jgi:hypothetical protein
MRRTDQIIAREPETEQIVASVLAKNEIDQESVRSVARDVLGQVPHPISEEGVGADNKLMSRIILHAGMSAEKAAEEAIEEQRREETRLEVMVRVTREAIEIESVYEPLAHQKPVFQE